jgi:radical SAM protein with 4Fe4S-binding SPASM domain
MLQEGKQLQNHNEIPCRAGKSSFWIDWQGRLSPCFALQRSDWSLNSSDFEAAWHKMVEDTQQIRLSDTCASCKNQSVCISCAGRAQCETGQPSGCPDYLCKWTKEMVKLAAHQDS